MTNGSGVAQPSLWQGSGYACRLLGLLAVILASPYSSTATAASYPPYPEIWDWTFEKPLQIRGLRRAKNGDVLVEYLVQTESPGGSRSSPPRYRSLFGGAELDAGTVASQLKNPDVALMSEARHLEPLATGNVVRRVGDGRRTTTAGCYAGVTGDFVQIEASDGRILGQRTFWVLSEKPKRFETKPLSDCADGPSFQYWAEPVIANFLSLQDNTFLLVDSDRGIVVRFDSRLETKSKLVNSRIYWLDLEAMRRLEQRVRVPVARGDYVDWAQMHQELRRNLLKKEGASKQ